MYITAMWVRSSNGGTGVNAAAYRHPQRSMAWPALREVALNPYPGAERGPSHIEVKEVGSDVQAYLDITLDDREYSPAVIEGVLNKARAALKGDADNPLGKRVKLGEEAEAYVVFSVTLGNEDPETKRHIFSLLRETLIPWLRREVPAENADRPPQAAGHA